VWEKFHVIWTCIVRVKSFWKLCVRSVFWSYLLCLKFFGFVILWSYRSYSNICVREISCHLDLYCERSKHLKFQSQFWSQFLLKRLISLWSSSIGLKFWADIENIYFMCLPKSQGFWSFWEWVVSHFVFRSQFEVASRK